MSLAVSVLYFIRSDTSASLIRRIITSAHGLSIAAAFSIAFLLQPKLQADSSRVLPFMLSLLIPVALILVSLLNYPGERKR